MKEYFDKIFTEISTIVDIPAFLDAASTEAEGVLKRDKVRKILNTDYNEPLPEVYVARRVLQHVGFARRHIANHHHDHVAYNIARIRDMLSISNDIDLNIDKDNYGKESPVRETARIVVMEYAPETFEQFLIALEDLIKNKERMDEIINNPIISCPLRVDKVDHQQQRVYWTQRDDREVSTSFHTLKYNHFNEAINSY
jgi:hypothetical protein